MKLPQKQLWRKRYYDCHAQEVGSPPVRRVWRAAEQRKRLRRPHIKLFFGCSIQVLRAEPSKMELPVIIAILAVVALVIFASGVFNGDSKKSEKKQSSGESAPSKASVASSVPAADVEKEKKGKKKKNRSNKTKSQKEKARAAAAEAAKTAKAASKSSTPVETSKTDDEHETQSESDSDSDSDSSDDDVPSGVRFQASMHLQAEKMKAQRNAMLEKEKRQNAKPAKSAMKVVEENPRSSDDDDFTPTTQVTDAAHFDGWAVVEDKRKNKPKKADTEESPSPVPVVPVSVPVAVVPEPEVAVSSPVPVVETVTTELKVDAKKVGLLIGPKGATKIQIQSLTGANINMPKAEKESTEPVTITVTGTALGVSKAVTALNELCTKGYATLLEPEDFQESYVAVHPRYVPEVIGKSGAAIRALQQHTGVKITIPPTKPPGPDGKAIKVKIGLAGRKEKVSQARALIKDLCKYYHTPVTHPGIVHEELELDPKYFNFIIGTKGSEIKNIQNTHKVQVHIPNADSVNPNVVIVGAEAGVSNAKKHIEKIIARVDGSAEAAAAAAESAAAAAVAMAAEVVSSSDEAQVPSSPVKPVSAVASSNWAGKSRIPIAPKEDKIPLPSADDAWMNDFVPPSSGIDLSAMLPSTAKFAPQPLMPAASPASPISPPVAVDPVVKKAPVAGSAWNNLSSLPNDKW